ncbi:MAG: hypothetical protein ACYCQJ_04855 [Nitrososphaerales archaeon]
MKLWIIVIGIVIALSSILPFTYKSCSTAVQCAIPTTVRTSTINSSTSTVSVCPAPEFPMRSYQCSAPLFDLGFILLILGILVGLVGFKSW